MLKSFYGIAEKLYLLDSTISKFNSSYYAKCKNAQKAHYGIGRPMHESQFCNNFKRKSDQIVCLMRMLKSTYHLTKKTVKNFSYKFQQHS